jgi:hypothetical protein
LIPEICDGAWDFYGRPQGSREEITTTAEYQGDVNCVVVSQEGDSNTYRWSVRSDVLRLTRMETT